MPYGKLKKKKSKKRNFKIYREETVSQFFEDFNRRKRFIEKITKYFQERKIFRSQKILLERESRKLDEL